MSTEPIVTEVVPRVVQAGTRVVVLGAHFRPSPALRVAFNDTAVTPTFHEACALLCTVPPLAVRAADAPDQMHVVVRVSQDGTTLSRTFAVVCLTGLRPAAPPPIS